MAVYRVEVTTGDMLNAGTFDYVYVTLIGTKGESKRTQMDNYGFDHNTGQTGSYTVKASSPLGKLLLVKVEKDPVFLLPENEWYCSKIVVTTPEDDVLLFPCYKWVSRGATVELRGGSAVKVFEEEHSLLINHRNSELTAKREIYQWNFYAEGVPMVVNYSNVSNLPIELQPSISRTYEISLSKLEIAVETMLKGLQDSTEEWKDIEDMKNVFMFKTTPMFDYVADHWMEDDFYGFQFLNAINPNVIQRCSKLPANFRVTGEMVKPFLEQGSSMQLEMEKGNIFICNYKRMDGVPTRLYNGEPLVITAGFCLLYKNPEDKLMPIAIQLKQQPSKENPVFLPSDHKTDWLLAKMFLRHADTIQYQAVFHLMNTHFLAEGFALATLRHLPMIHPLYKLLNGNFHYTFQINVTGRAALFKEGGPLAQTSAGNKGLVVLMARALSEMTYSSLCLPENIKERGLESIPNFYYRDDGLKLWEIINSFAKGVVEYYYPCDGDVSRDTELQAWINEIFTNTFLGNPTSGIPTAFQTVEELIKFITMVIFTVTGQHHAVHKGQYDYNSWTANNPMLMRKPPPSIKGQSSMKTILETLPNVKETVGFMALGWLLTQPYSDAVYIGTYPEEHFHGHVPKQMIKEFKEQLSSLSEEIETRNLKLPVPYEYLNPAEIESSVTI